MSFDIIGTGPVLQRRQTTNKSIFRIQFYYKTIERKSDGSGSSMAHVAFVIFLVAVSGKFGFSDNVTVTGVNPEDVAEETQHAICKIITQEIQTSANATVKRQLKGVCTTKQIERKFKQLEKKLLQELDHIKTLLTNDRGLGGVTVKTNDYSEEEYFNYDEKSGDNIVSVTETITREKSWTRTEISKLNGTVFTLKGEKVFTYYWEIPKIRSILRKSGVHIRSPDFVVLGTAQYRCPRSLAHQRTLTGHDLCIQLYPNHLNSNYLGMQLRPSGNFWKKHRFTILEQFDSSRDIKSQILGGVSSYEAIYKVPYEKLEERRYLYNDTIILKVTIYLNS